VRTIAIVNQKGGCGKTTTAINLAAIYARRGLRTLLVDMDPQGHCAAGLGVPEHKLESSIAEALIAEHDETFDPSTLLWEVSRNLDLAPSSVRLAMLEAPEGGIHRRHDKDRRLESLLSLLADRYDRCLIDCPPTIGLLTFNALRAARETLVPVETGFFSLRGAERQWNTLQKLIQHIQRPIACHMLPSMHDPKSRIARDILGALRRQFAGVLMPVVIRLDELIREATSYGQPVMEYAPGSQAHQDFEDLADWLEEHIAAPMVEIEIMPGGTTVPSISAARPREAGEGSELRSYAPTSIAPPPQRQPVMPGATGGGRAAELVRRMQRHSAQALEVETPAEPEHPGIERMRTAIAVRATTARATEAAVASPASAGELQQTIVLSEPEPAQALQGGAEKDISHLYGVRATATGAIFIQPGTLGRTVHVAGDFNRWSPTATPMRHNAALGVLEVFVKLPPGAYQYRLIVDGRWEADRYNTRQFRNEHGEPNSLVTIEEKQPGS